MVQHHPEILAFQNCAVGNCSCGELFRERFGPRRASQAKDDLMAHLSYVYGAADDEDTIEEYQIGPRDDLVCPICKSKLDIDRDLLPELLDSTTPSVLSCAKGHEFDSYYKNLTLFLFPLQTGDYTPFSTSE